MNNTASNYLKNEELIEESGKFYIYSSDTDIRSRVSKKDAARIQNKGTELIYKNDFTKVWKIKTI